MTKRYTEQDFRDLQRQRNRLKMDKDDAFQQFKRDLDAESLRREIAAMGETPCK